MRLCRPHCPPALGVPLLLLAVALAGPSDALAAFHRDETPLSPALTSDSGAAHSGGGGGTGAFARMLVGLVIVIAVIYGVYWLLKTYNKSKTSGGLRDDGRIEVLATTALAPSRSVHLLRIGNDLVLVGSSEGGVTPLRVYEPGDARRLELEALDGSPAVALDPGRRGSMLEELRRRTAR